MTVYAVPGYEPEDLAQEASLALLRAGNPTGTLANVIVHRRMISLLRAATSQRHRPLNESLRRAEHDGDEVPATDLIVGGRDPADIVAARDELRRRGAELTPIERRALVYVVAGIPYQRERWIDNAVTRARKRLKDAA